MELELYDVLALAHILFFVYWLGADLGVFYAARFSADAELSLETRLVIADIMAFVDLFPRLSVPMIGVVGAHMAYLSGDLYLSARGMALLWFIALVWVVVTMVIYLNRKGSLNLGPWMRFDWYWRSGILLVVGAVSLFSFLGYGITDNSSLSLKMLIYASAILFSLVLRFTFKPYRPALKRIIEGGDNIENSLIMKKSLAAAKPVILGLWFLTVAAAAIGLWQPL